MKILVFIFALSVSTFSLGASILSKNAVPAVSIVVSDNASAVEKTSAKELKAHLDEMTGASFEIVSLSKKSPDSKSIFVGDFKQSRAVAGLSDSSEFKYDEIKIKTDSDGNIALLGHAKRGTLYAVYTFLEDCLGVRWWSENEKTVPYKPTLEVGDIDVSYAPKFILREALYKIAFDGVFASRMKQNGSTLTRMNFERPVISNEYGGCEQLVLFRSRGSSFHSHFEILPPEKYFKDHPEWYSMIDGKRQYKSAQLCLTNEEMAAEYLKNVKSLLRENPIATSIQVSQNDWNGACECPKCKAIDDANGSQSGTNLYFANKIAEGIEKEFPNVWIDTFAYQYTRRAPTQIKPRKNVLVRLCTIECSFLKPLEDGVNGDFVRDITEWGKITKNLFIWDYVTTFRSFMIPHPNMRVLVPNIRFFEKNSALGIFEQGDAFCSAGDFVRLRNWVISHLMWNPYSDEKKLFDEFLYGYYGEEVGAILKEYLTLIHDTAEKSNIYLRCFFYKVPMWMDNDTYNKSAVLWDKAVETAKKLEGENPKKYAGLLKKVRREKLSFDHLSIVFYRDFMSRAHLAGEKINLPENPMAAVEKLIADWNEFNVETWREFTTPAEFKDYQNSLRLDTERQLKLLEMEKSAPKNDPFKTSMQPAMEYSQADIIAYSWKTYSGFLADFIADKNASNGYASIVPESLDNLKIQMDVSRADIEKILPDAKSFKFYIAMRGVAKNSPFKASAKVQAANFIVFNKNWKNIYSKNFSEKELDGEEYRTFETSPFEISKTDFPIYIAFRTPSKENKMKVLIDRIFLKPTK